MNCEGCGTKIDAETLAVIGQYRAAGQDVPEYCNDCVNDALRDAMAQKGYGRSDMSRLIANYERSQGPLPSAVIH